MTPELKAAVERELAARPGTGMRTGATSLSAHYRSGGRSDASIDLSAYLAARLPATFAAVQAVLREVRREKPDFMPGSVLDAGSGPGTASWAAAETWTVLAQFTMLDSNPVFLSLAKRLAAESPHGGLGAANFRNGQINGLTQRDRADLVIASYALAEIAESGLRAAVAALWAAAGAMLVLVEPGTPAGFARLRAARESLLRAGAVPVAPCTHALDCPMTGGNWCHFSVRLARSRAHMHAKGASVPFEDEKFAYLALARDGVPSGGGRILSPPLDQKHAVSFSLCKERGIESRDVAKRQREAYRSIRKKGWGDWLPDTHELEDGI
jgi:ribosomal protein RSM22 (predicted rRNA methylase)